MIGGKVNILGGQKCKKGPEYVKKEVLCPHRTITTSVLVEKGVWPLVSVKTTVPVPKERIFSIMESIKTISIRAPIALGDIISKRIGGTQANLVATKKISSIETTREEKIKKTIQKNSVIKNKK